MISLTCPTNIQFFHFCHFECNFVGAGFSFNKLGLFEINILPFSSNLMCKTTTDTVSLPKNGRHCPKRAQLQVFGTKCMVVWDRMHKMIVPKNAVMHCRREISGLLQPDFERRLLMFC